MLQELPDNLRRTLDGMAREFHAAADAMLDPAVLADHRRMRALTSKRTALEPVVTRWDAWCAMEREARELASIATGTDAELAAIARGELPELRTRSSSLVT
ncbi:MAG: PCRF domain-containing protein, partial [Phycisphaerales bacterium]